VVFDAAQTFLAELRRWGEECGLHCAGQVAAFRVKLASPMTWLVR
jgi:hypothetical protein